MHNQSIQLIQRLKHQIHTQRIPYHPLPRHRLQDESHTLFHLVNPLGRVPFGQNLVKIDLIENLREQCLRSFWDALFVGDMSEVEDAEVFGVLGKQFNGKGGVWPFFDGDWAATVNAAVAGDILGQG